MELTHQELWAKCCRFIQDNISAEQYKNWFRDITSESYADGRLVLTVQIQHKKEQGQRRVEQPEQQLVAPAQAAVFDQEYG